MGGTKGVQPISGCSWEGVYSSDLPPCLGKFCTCTHTYTHTDPEMHTQTDKKTKTGSLHPSLLVQKHSHTNSSKNTLLLTITCTHRHPKADLHIHTLKYRHTHYYYLNIFRLLVGRLVHKIVSSEVSVAPVLDVVNSTLVRMNSSYSEERWYRP